MMQFVMMQFVFPQFASLETAVPGRGTFRVAYLTNRLRRTAT